MYAVDICQLTSTKHNHVMNMSDISSIFVRQRPTLATLNRRVHWYVSGEETLDQVEESNLGPFAPGSVVIHFCHGRRYKYGAL